MTKREARITLAALLVLVFGGLVLIQPVAALATLLFASGLALFVLIVLLAGEAFS